MHADAKDARAEGPETRRRNRCRRASRAARMRRDAPRPGARAHASRAFAQPAEGVDRRRARHGRSSPRGTRSGASPAASASTSRPLRRRDALADAAQAIALDIVFEDAAIIVLNKPAGLVVHPGSGNRDGTLLNALLHHHPALAALPRAGIVHRLDKDTSGLMVVAKTPEAHTELVRQLAARTVTREYLAVARGDVARATIIDAPIGRHPTQRTTMAVVDKRQARAHARRRRRALRRGDTLALHARNRPHAPDPRASRRDRTSARRRSRVWRQARRRRRSRVSPAGAARDAPGPRSSDDAARRCPGMHRRRSTSRP